MNEPKVSLIIPLYNAEKYIRECLISVLASRFTDYEVLVVDDCSTDNSVAEVKKLLPHFDGRLKIFTTEKNSGGAGVPRNIGIKNASGKYVTFIDNDDMILPDALGLFFETAEFYNADVLHTEKCLHIVGNSKDLKLFNFGRVENFVDKPTPEPDDLTGRMQHFVYEDFYCVPWGKFFRRDFLLENKIEFPSMMQYGEDYIFCFKCLCLAKKYLLVPYVTNIHRVGIVSASCCPKYKTAQDGLRRMLGILIKKVTHINKFMRELEFFKENPQWYLAVLKYTIDTELNMIKNFFRNIPLHELQKFFLNELQNPELNLAGKNLLTAYLCTEKFLNR